MKRIKKYTCLIITTLLFFGCSNNKDKDPVFTLDLDNLTNSSCEIKTLSSIASEIDYVVLETNQKSLINQIYSILQIPNGYLIQDSQKQLLFFDNNGIFGWKIESLGRGPNEFNYLASFDYNNFIEEVIIHSRNVLLFYDLNGEHKKTLKIDEGLNNIKCLPNGNLIGISSNSVDKRVLTINQEGKIINERILLSKKTDGNPVITSHPLLEKHHNQVLFTNMDTIWQTTNGLDFIPKIRITNRKEGEPFRIRKYLEDYIVVTYTFNRIRAIIDVTTGEYFICKGNDRYGLVDDIHSGPALYPGYENNGLILNTVFPSSIVDSGIQRELLSDSTRARLFSIGENNNPIIRVIRLKDRIDIN